MRILLFILVILVSNLVISQEKLVETSSFSITNDVNILDTPRFYRSYFSEYNLNKNWFLRLEMQEKSHNNLLNSYTNIEYPLLVRYNISNKHSVFFGPKINILKVDGGVSNVSLFSTFGYQYDITEDLSVDARVDYNLIKKESIDIANPTNTTNYGGDYVLYKVGAKLKF
ncbi:hypothetical protein APS56_03300 [Pseudalgibacter alginicilyticus]|uniref:Outer membrane protein beta-barrel domain-containing protein n=1 Tax=Pseudalgibacter alginicilyticus TaxID=1736674 RepID=A0A0P0CIL0_9FLAO|nr:hypothetical protein [Pseudalgibacter alginicilyticus]ALJ04228.1 hypothetical protein APS56_03300 [Pseudalgibacter alginicilyticus]